MTDKASGVLAKHQAQMDMILERIDGTGHKKKVFMAVEDYSRKQEEMEALQFKLTSCFCNTIFNFDVLLCI
jgi:hypothetical protein